MCTTAISDHLQKGSKVGWFKGASKTMCSYDNCYFCAIIGASPVNNIFKRQQLITTASYENTPNRRGDDR